MLNRKSHPAKLLIFIIFISISSCNDYSNQNNSVNSNVIQTVIQEDTAKYIAKGFLVFDYNLREFDFITIEKDKSWIIQGKLKSELKEKYKNTHQADPSVEISKSDGKIIGFNVPK